MSTSLEILENVWSASPGGLVFAQYADALQSAGRAKDAHSVLTQGLANWPRHFAGRMLLGQVCQQLGDLEGARSSFQEAVSLDNRSPSALRNLAEILGKQQYQRQAVDLWVRLSLLDPDDRDVAATARKMIGDLETTSSLADLGLGIREIEDVASREALTEGTSSTGGLPGALAGLESAAPVSGWMEPAAPAAAPGFDLGDLAFPVAPSNIAPATTWSPGAGMDSTIAQVPVQPGASLASPSAEPPVFPKMGGDDSALATIEMASFPARTIPPPPLELPKAPHPGNETGTHVLNVIQSPEELDATQAMPRPQTAQVTGEDIGARLDDMFGALGVDDLPAIDPMATVELPPPAPIAVPPAPVPVPSASISPAPARVTGDDVEERLSEIFGSPSDVAGDLLPPPPAPVAAPPRQSAGVPKAAVTGDDIEARLDDLFGASSVDLPIQDLASKVADESRPSSSGPVNGNDIEARIESMFGAATQQESREAGDETSAMPRPDLLGDASEPDATATIESMRSFQAAGMDKPFGSVDPSDVDSGGSTLDLPTVGVIPGVPSSPDSQRLSGAKDLDSQLDELFASSEFLVEQAPPPVPQRAGGANQGAVTGDDIGDRLDDLFGADSDFPAGVPTVTLAEEYLRQGYRDQAIAVYRQLISREPGNTEFVRRLAQIEAGV